MSSFGTKQTFSQVEEHTYAMLCYAINLYKDTRIYQMTLIPIDRKQLILKDAKKRILLNHTLEQIAVSHNESY